MGVFSASLTPHLRDDTATLRDLFQLPVSLFPSSDLTSRKWAIFLYFGETEKGAEMHTERLGKVTLDLTF